MVKWKRDEFVENEIWFHATSATHVEKILTGVIADINKTSALDFGYGLYLTPSFEWAKKYIAGLEYENPKIIEFHFKPLDFINQGASFRFFDTLNDEFADFIFENRINYRNYETMCVHNYAMVGGVMSDGNILKDFYEFKHGKIDKIELYRRICQPREDWQICIHSQDLCDQLHPFLIHDGKGGM